MDQWFDRSNTETQCMLWDLECPCYWFFWNWFFHKTGFWSISIVIIKRIPQLSFCCDAKTEEQNAEYAYGSCTCDVDMCELSCRPVRSEDDTLTGVPRCSRMLTFRSRSIPGTCRGGAFPKDQRLESYSRQEQHFFHNHVWIHLAIKQWLHCASVWWVFISLCYPEYGTERAAESVLTWTNLCVLLVLPV